MKAVVALGVVALAAVCMAGHHHHQDHDGVDDTEDTLIKQHHIVTPVTFDEWHPSLRRPDHLLNFNSHLHQKNYTLDQPLSVFDATTLPQSTDLLTSEKTYLASQGHAKVNGVMPSATSASLKLKDETPKGDNLDDMNGGDTFSESQEEGSPDFHVSGEEDSAFGDGHMAIDNTPEKDSPKDHIDSVGLKAPEGMEPQSLPGTAPGGLANMATEKGQPNYHGRRRRGVCANLHLTDQTSTSFLDGLIDGVVRQLSQGICSQIDGLINCGTQIYDAVNDILYHSLSPSEFVKHLQDVMSGCGFWDKIISAIEDATGISSILDSIPFINTISHTIDSVETCAPLFTHHDSTPYDTGITAGECLVEVAKTVATLMERREAVRINGTIEVPSAWTCPPQFYAADDGCDHGCGLLDPDCLHPTSKRARPASQLGMHVTANAPAFFSHRSSAGKYRMTKHQNVPKTWICPAEYYDTMDGCDMNCGAEDPDCDSNDATVYEWNPAHTFTVASTRLMELGLEDPERAAHIVTEARSLSSCSIDSSGPVPIAMDEMSAEVPATSSQSQPSTAKTTTNSAPDGTVEATNPGGNRGVEDKKSGQQGSGSKNSTGSTTLAVVLGVCLAVVSSMLAVALIVLQRRASVQYKHSLLVNEEEPNGDVEYALMSAATVAREANA